MGPSHEQSSVLRYCPKCGAAGLRPVGVKLWHCGHCGFELFMNVAAAVAALIVDHEGRLLVVVRAGEPGKGMWDLPGGFVDPAESAEEALRREVAEELGLEITSARFIASYPNTYEYMGFIYPTVDLGFTCEVVDLAKMEPSEAEIGAVMFVPLEEVDIARFAFASLGRMVNARREGFP